jgi:hypothetical protein
MIRNKISVVILHLFSAYLSLNNYAVETNNYLDLRPIWLVSSRRDLLNLSSWCQTKESTQYNNKKLWKFHLITKWISLITWQQTRKMKSVIAVHSTFSRNWIFRSGFWISGNMLQKGFTNSKNLIPILSDWTPPLQYFHFFRSENTHNRNSISWGIYSDRIH